MKTAQIFALFPVRHTPGLLPMALIALVLGHTEIRAQSVAGCQMRQPSQGWPRDYRVDRNWLPGVERRHFTLRVEMLISGESTSQPGGDIGYTLNQFPNHHRALISLSRLGKRLGVAKVSGMDHSVDCYFERAVGYKPDDTVARLLYAQHLGSTGRPNQARQQLALTVPHAGDNPLTHYNIGLIAFELKDYDRALAQAHRAQALDLPRTELRDMLQREGRWTEPLAAAAAAASAASPAPSASSSAPESAPAAATPAAPPPVGSR